MNLNNYKIKFLTLDEQEILRTHLHKYMRESEYNPSYWNIIKNIPNIILTSNSNITKQNLKNIYKKKLPILFLTLNTKENYLPSSSYFDKKFEKFSYDNNPIPISSYFNKKYEKVSKGDFFSKNYCCKYIMKIEHYNIIDSYINVSVTDIDIDDIHNKIISYFKEVFMLLNELLIFDITSYIFKIYIDFKFD